MGWPQAALIVNFAATTEASKAMKFCPIRALPKGADYMHCRSLCSIGMGISVTEVQRCQEPSNCIANWGGQLQWRTRRPNTRSRLVSTTEFG